jgi:hypothetical protein
MLNRRTSIRHPTPASPAHIEWLEGGALHESEARLINISQDGALLSTDLLPPLQYTVWMSVDEPTPAAEVRAKVVRYGELNQVGLLFTEDCPLRPPLVPALAGRPASP